MIIWRLNKTTQQIRYKPEKSTSPTSLYDNGQRRPLDHEKILDPFFPRLNSETVPDLEIEPLDNKACDHT